MPRQARDANDHLPGGRDICAGQRSDIGRHKVIAQGTRNLRRESAFANSRRTNDFNDDWYSFLSFGPSISLHRVHEALDCGHLIGIEADFVFELGLTY